MLLWVVMSIKFIFNNEADVFGGQERYAKDVISSLVCNGYEVLFEGTPLSLSKYALNIPRNKADVRFLNGNRVLFKSLTKRKQTEFWVYVQHSNIEDSQGRWYKKIVRKVLVRLCLRRVDLVIRVCENALPSLYSKNKIITIYNGVDLPKESSITEVNAGEDIRLLMVGSVNENKNQKLAIETLAILPNAILTIVGEGVDSKLLQDYANELGVGGRVNWTGFVDDPSEYYKDAHFLLMLSKFEAFPYSVLEAMSYGTPVISVAVGGVPELIEDRNNGWILNQADSDSLRAKIIDIVDNPTIYLKNAYSARSAIENNFTKDKMFSVLINEIKKGLNLL